MSLEFLKPKESFQYSINLEYDLLDDSASTIFYCKFKRMSISNGYSKD